MEWLLEIFFPHRCVACHALTEREYLCRKCLNAMPIKGQSECIGCKRATPDGRTCVFCAPDNPLDRLLIVSDFKNPIVTAVIKRMKYGPLPDLVKPLHGLTQKYLKFRARRSASRSFLEGNPILVPVPLHWRRMNWRGFDQAALLTERLAGAYHMESVAALHRDLSRGPQADIKERQRRLENVKGVYSCPAPDRITGRNVMLVDDVCTTGATLNECARVLKTSGAKSVSALVLARG